MDTKQQLVNALAGLGSTITEAMDVIEGFVPCGHPALTVSNALVALDTDDDAALAEQNITPSKIRLSIGTENAEDIIWDLKQAFAALDE